MSPEVEVLCHDRTPYADFKCEGCGFIMHVHESQLPANYEELELRTFCHGCGCELVLPQPIEWIGRYI